MTLLNGAMPPFALDGGLGLAATRGLFDAALSCGAGGPVLARMAGAGPGAGASAAIGLRAGRAGLLCACALGLAWLVEATGDMAGADGPGALVRALPVAALHTRFGRLLLAQLALALAGAWLLGAGARRARSGGRDAAAAFGTAAAVAALALQAGHGHALAMAGRSADGWGLGGWGLVGSGAAHLLAGGAWLGSLPPLARAVSASTPGEAARLARRYGKLGIACVAVLAGTATWQGLVLIGSWAGLAGTAYGWVACAKIALFGGLVAIAARNRFRLAPRLGGTAPDRARRRLAASIALEAGLGGALMLAAGVLSGLPPAMHTEPVWPFTQAFSLVTIDEDADFRREALLALAALAGAAALAAGAFALRPRPRVAALAVAALVAGLAAPHLDLLLVQAYPTSFARSPTGYRAASIADGAALFAARCAACHGEDGAGHGPLAARLPVPPDDLTSPMIGMHDDGELFWWLSHGIEGPGGALAMPGFAGVLTASQIWSVIDAVRAHAAGVAFRDGGGPVPAPAFDTSCDGDGDAGAPDRRRRGRVTVVAQGDAPPSPTPRGEGPAPILVVASPATGPGAPAVPPGACVAADDRLGAALAIAAGLPPRPPPPGSLFVIDGANRLVAALAPDADRSQDRRARLAAALDRARAAPAVPAGAGMAGMAGMAPGTRM